MSQWKKKIYLKIVVQEETRLTKGSKWEREKYTSESRECIYNSGRGMKGCERERPCLSLLLERGKIRSNERKGKTNGG